MFFDGTSFNEKWVMSFTRDEFVKSQIARRHWPKITDELRTEKLELLWDLIKVKHDNH